MRLVNVVCLVLKLKTYLKKSLHNFKCQLRLTAKIVLSTMQAKPTTLLNSYHGSTNISFPHKETLTPLSMLLGIENQFFERENPSGPNLCLPPS